MKALQNYKTYGMLHFLKERKIIPALFFDDVLLPIPLPPQPISACCWRWAEMQFPVLTNDESRNFLSFFLLWSLFPCQVDHALVH